MAERTVRFIALDPGETTGYARFDEAGQLIDWGQFSQSEQAKWLTNNITDLQAVIIEDYKNYSSFGGQKRWSRNQTSKNIGAIEMVCEMRSIPYFLQPANIKTIGYKWAGLVEAPTNHKISHQFDAVAHGTYWLRMRGILKPSVPEE